MRVTKISVRRSAKINTGNYENTDVEVTLEAQLGVDDTVDGAFRALGGVADALVREKVDDIEMGKRKVASKAGRFGI